MTTDPVGWAEERSDVPTIYHLSRCEMVGTLRFAHPTFCSIHRVSTTTAAAYGSPRSWGRRI